MNCDVLQCDSQFLWLESKRSGLALIGDLPFAVDQVNSIGPAGVGFLRGIVEAIEHGGKLYPQFANATARHKLSLLIIFRTGEDNLFFYVALALPHVGGMGFQDIHDEEGDSRPVLVVKFVEGRNLPPEWRSSVAAEDQNHGLPGAQS